MNRREFLKSCAIAGISTGIGGIFGGTKLHGADDKTMPDVVAVRGGEPDTMFDKGIEALGGMSAFVKKNQTVLVKPNISWAFAPECAATTNPALVKRIVEQCLKAGAKTVYVTDHLLMPEGNSVNEIARYARDAGAVVIDGNVRDNYQEVVIPGGKYLKKAEVLKLAVTCDVFINVPILKNHSGSKLTCAMKNLMGIVWDMKYFHNNLDQCIADIPLFRKPTLNVVDAYRVMVDNGPRYKNDSKIINPKMQFLSTDIVAVDAVSLAQARSWKVVSGDVPFVKLAYENHLGKMDVSKMNIRKIEMS